MSVAPLCCEGCNVESEFECAGPFPPGQERSYGVAWVCPSCARRALDVCNLGPLIPTPASCLNCGAERGDDARCHGCGLPESDARIFLGVDGNPTIDDAIDDARRGLLQRAIARCNAMLAGAPAAVEAWRLKGDLLRLLGFHEATAVVLRHAADVADAPALLFAAGYALQELGRDEEAVAVYREALDRLPESPNASLAWSKLGNSLSALGRSDEADRAHARALALSPARATLAFNYVHHLHSGARWLESLPILEDALAIASDPATRVMLLFTLARAHAELENGAGALAAADAAVELDDSSVGAHYLRGRALCLLGRLDEGMREMQHILALDPDNSDAAAAVRVLEAAGVEVSLPS